MGKHEVLIPLGRLALAKRIAEIVEHLQRDPEIGAEILDYREYRKRNSGERRAQRSCKAHQRAGFKSRRGHAECGYLILRDTVNVSAEIDSLAEMGPQQRTVVRLVDLLQLMLWHSELPKNLKGPEIKPVTGVERQWHRKPKVERRTAAPNFTPVLDVIDDQGSGMNELDGLGSQAAALIGKPRRLLVLEKSITAEDQLAPYPLAAARYGSTHRLNQGAPQNRFERSAMLDSQKLAPPLAD